MRMIGTETTITDLTKLKHAYKEIEDLIKTKPESYKKFIRSIGDYTTNEVLWRKGRERKGKENGRGEELPY